MSNPAQQSWNLKPVQAAVLQIFECFSKICKRHNLRYYAMAGTALGAVRHGGFIPWDDDFDVMMPREDYVAFKKVVSDELPPGLKASSGGLGPMSPISYMQIWNTDPSVISELSRLSNLNLKHPPFLDVFVLDGVPSYVGDINKWWRRRRIHRLCQIYRYPGTCPGKGVVFSLRRLLIRVIGFFVSLFYTATKSNEEMVQLLDKVALETPYDKAYMVTEPTFFRMRTRRLMPKSVIEPAREVKFEGTSIMVPANVEEYLTRIYGDYMKLPPVEQRIPEHILGHLGGVPEWDNVI